MNAPDHARELLEMRSRVDAQHSQVEQILETISEGFLAFDRDWTFTYVNRRAGEFLRRDPAELLGRNLWAEFPESLGTSFRHAFERGMREQEPVEIEDYDPPLDRWFHCRVIPSGGGVVVFFSDVTGQRRAALEHRELERRLRRAEMLATLGTLVGSVAHEARGPLFGITSTLEALEARVGESSPVSAHVRALRTASDRLQGLMKGLLEYSRPAVREPGRLAVADLVLTTFERCRDELAPDVRLVLAEPVTDAIVLGDRERLLIALRNIVGNAIQHTPARGTVRVVTEVVEHDGKPWVEMRVIDEGQGFRGDVAAQAAEPFYTRRRGGTGLGLAIASRAIEEAGGRLTFDNTPAGSGQVRILLPRHHD